MTALDRPYRSSSAYIVAVMSESSKSDDSTHDSSLLTNANATVKGRWTADEHDRFLCAMAQFPIGPWCAIAEIVGTRSVRQVHSHAQKYAAKVERHRRGHSRVKRDHLTGDLTEPSGHRVVVQIPGKFLSGVAESRHDVTGESGPAKAAATRNEEEAAPAAHALLPRAGAQLQSGGGEPRPQPRPYCHYGILSSIRESGDRPQEGAFVLPPLLPSLDESLDFFIRHFADE